jgi:PKD repeat protein
MERYTTVILILLWILLVQIVSAGGISESLAGKTADQVATTKAVAMVNDAGVKALAVDRAIDITDTDTGKPMGEITIKSITYDEKMGAMKVLFTATINGREKQITNPVYIRNPPVRVVTGSKEVDGKVEYTTEENPQKAMMDVLLQIASTKKDGKATFIPGDPTLIVYANAADGFIYNVSTPAGILFNTLSRNSEANSSSFSDTSGYVYEGGVGYNNWTSLKRTYFPFNTSTIASTSGLTSAAFMVYGGGKGLAGIAAESVGITYAYPVNPTSIAVTDFKNVDHIAIAPNISYSSYAASGTNIFNLTNLTQINKTGFTTIAARTASDINGVAPSTGGGTAYTQFGVKFAENDGTTYDPYMEIIYVENVTPPEADFSCTPTGGYSPLLVTCTDSSTSAPNAWNWSFGDGYYSSDQNPTHTYTGYGVYSVNMTATNAWGTDFELKPNYISVSVHPAVNLTSHTHFVFNGTNQSEVTNFSWQFSDDGNITTYYGKDIEHWLEWNRTHVATMTAVYGTNTTVGYQVVNLMGGSGGTVTYSGNASRGGGGTSVSSEIPLSAVFGLIGGALGGLAAAGLAMSSKRRRDDY